MLKDKILVSFLAVSTSLHLGFFMPLPNFFSFKSEEKKKEYVEVEYYEIPKVMVRAKDSKVLKELDPFSKENKKSLSKKDDEVIAKEGDQDVTAEVEKLVKKSYYPGMDLPSYAELLYEIIKFYLIFPENKGPKKTKVRVEFSISETGNLMFIDIPYGEGNVDYNMNIASLNAVTLASKHFPPLPSCVKKSSQLFKVWIMQK